MADDIGDEAIALITKLNATDNAPSRTKRDKIERLRSRMKTVNRFHAEPRSHLIGVIAGILDYLADET